MSKVFVIPENAIKPLVAPMGSCIASDKITVEGLSVRFMYRDYPDRKGDSGWVFMSGTESEGYANDPKNLELYAVNTIANYDPGIIPYLDTPPPVALERPDVEGPFIVVPNFVQDFED